MISDYSTLGLPPTATLRQIKQAYKDLAIKYHPDKMRNNPFLDPIDFKKIKHSYQSLLKKKQPQENVVVLKQLIDQIPSDQLKYYEEVLEDDSESEEEEDDEYLLMQTLSLNELKQKAHQMGEGDRRGKEEGREGEGLLTLTKYQNLKNSILNPHGKHQKRRGEESEGEGEGHQPSREKLREMIRNKQPVFTIIY